MFVVRFVRNAVIITRAITVALKTEGGTPVKNIKHNNPTIVETDLK